MRISVFLVQKNFGSFEIYGVSALTEEGVEPVRTFFGQEERLSFRDFVRTSFMDGL